MTHWGESRKYIAANAHLKTAKELQAHLGIKLSIVYLHLKQSGLKPKKKAPVNPKPNKKSERQFVLDNYKTYSVEDLAKFTGFSTKAVQGILHRAGLVCTVIDATTQLIMDRYKNTTVKSLAQLTGLSHTKIYYVMEKYNLKPYVQISGKSGHVPYGKMKVQSFENCIRVPIGYNRIEIVVPKDASHEYIMERKVKMLQRLGVAVYCS